MNIKFRVFDKALQKYLYALSGIVFDDGIESYKYEDIGFFLDCPNLYVCEQFTGILDKNGKEIYEGDILAEKHDHASDYTGDEETYIKHHIVRKVPGYFTYDEDDKFSLILNAFNGVNSYVEVVGNIYENPELIDPNDLV
jgi:uncharacterized phage protein (TIGR01671 family)